MALTPSGPQTSVKYKLTGPDGTIATFNEPADPNFVGYLTETTGLDSPEVRESAENIAGLDGGIHGSFFYGRRQITLAGSIINITSAIVRNEKMTKLQQASNAMREDATLEWTPEGGEAQFLKVRRAQPLRITGPWNKDFQLALVAADPRIYSTALSSPEETLAEPAITPSAGAFGGDMVASPDGKNVYLRDETNLTVYTRNTETGVLTELEKKSPVAKMTCLAISSDGKNVYVGAENVTPNGKIIKFTRNTSTGALTTLGTEIALARIPTSLAVSPGGKWAVMALRVPAGFVASFKRNAATGELTLVELKEIAAGGASNVSFFPMADNVVFVINGTPTLVQYEINETTGVLTVQKSYTIAGGSFVMSPEQAYVLPTEMVGYLALLFFNKKYVFYKYTYNPETKKASDISLVMETPTFYAGGSSTSYNALWKSPAGVWNYYVLSSTETWPKWTMVRGQTLTNNFTLSTTTKSLGVGEVTYQLLAIGNHLYGSFTNGIVRWSLTKTGSFIRGSAKITATNKGSMETFGIITVTTKAAEELTQVSFLNETTEEAIPTYINMPQNSTLILDLLNRTITLNGYTVYSGIEFSNAQWWSIAPGTNKLAIGATSVTGSPKAKIEFRSAWI